VLNALRSKTSEEKKDVVLSHSSKNPTGYYMGRNFFVNDNLLFLYSNKIVIRIPVVYSFIFLLSCLYPPKIVVDIVPFHRQLHRREGIERRK
jgi:hypothetical protein